MMTFIEAKETIANFRAKTIQEYNEAEQQHREDSIKWFEETTGWKMKDFLAEELRKVLEQE